MLTYTQKCFSQSMGLWMVREDFASQFMMALKSGLITQGVLAPVRAQSDRLYDFVGGWAVVPVVGQTTKGGDSFGGGSTVQARRGIRNALADGQDQIMMYFDTPGGHVAGAHELAEDIRKAGEQVRVEAHIQDQCTSAGYWAASQAQRITASAGSFIGNVGVVGAILDTSAAADIAGIKVHLLSTGEFKGAGHPGVPVTERQIAHMQGLVDQQFELFVDAVTMGRDLSDDQLEEVLTGKVFMPRDALSLGLIDDVADFQDVLEGDSSMDEQTLAAAMVGALQAAGVIQTQASSEPETPDETITVKSPQAPEESETEDEKADSTTAAAYPQAPASAVMEGELVAGGIGPTYQEGVEKGRMDCVAILEQCTITGKSAADALTAIQSGATPDKFRSDLYAERVGSDPGEVNNAPPVTIARSAKSKEATPVIDVGASFEQRRKMQVQGA